MALQRKTKTTWLAKAKVRAAGLRQIDETIEFDGGVSLASLVAAIAKVEDALATYNSALSAADDLANAIVAVDKELGEECKRVLTGVETRFGDDSSQYEMVGGVRKSERKKPKSNGDAATGDTQ